MGRFEVILTISMQYNTFWTFYIRRSCIDASQFGVIDSNEQNGKKMTKITIVECKESISTIIQWLIHVFYISMDASEAILMILKQNNILWIFWAHRTCIDPRAIWFYWPQMSKYPKNCQKSWFLNVKNWFESFS